MAKKLLPISKKYCGSKFAIQAVQADPRDVVNSTLGQLRDWLAAYGYDITADAIDRVMYDAVTNIGYDEEEDIEEEKEKDE